MKMLLFEISGYKKIYTGTGLDKITIDFSKSTNPICLIVGPNGSGKSSLAEAMQPYPDTNDNFLEGRRAYKKIVYDNGYSIYIEHSVDSKGQRQQAKAYIKKVSLDGEIELNPNGNISSYKELLESELEIDGSFIALSRLSTEDKGIAQKRPAERKKFLNTIVPNMDVYNAINKTIVKRSSIFKSMINSLTTKIDNIGNPEQLNSTLVSLNNRLNKLEVQKNETIASISQNEAKIKIIDPDTSIQNLYEEVSKQLIEVKAKLDTIDIDKYKGLVDCDFNIDALNTKYKLVNDLITQYNFSIDSLNERINNLLISKEEDVKIIQTKIEKLNMLKADINIEELESKIDNYSSLIEEAYNITNMIGIDPDKVSKDEFLSGLNVLEDIQSIVNNFKSGVDLQIVKFAINYIKNNDDPVKDLEYNEKVISKYNDEIDILKSEIKDLDVLKSKMEILDHRPKTCKDNDCYFIKDAYNASLQYSEEDYNTKVNRLNFLYDEIVLEKDFQNNLKETIECYNSIKVIIRNINNYNTVLKKLPYGDIYSNIDSILDKIENNDVFKEIDIMKSWKDNANILESIKIYKDTLYKLNTDYEVYKSKNSVIDELDKEIISMNKKLDSIKNEIEEKISTINKIQSEVIISNNTLNLINECIAVLKQYNELDALRIDCENKISTVQSNMNQITLCINIINNLNQVLNNIYNEIKSVTDDRDKIKYSLSVLEDYKSELAIYQEKYETIETIKYYSSPSTGIQTLFIKLYMANTLNLANTLLSNLFEGEIILEPYIIDENNFRIPVINGGMYIDDISSCSTAQKSLIAMILSFTMLKQSSSTFNILRLDEIDGGLDTNNRIQFINVLKELMNILSVDQLIMVSHNNELSTENIDKIVLKDTGINYDNVIWRNE